MKPDRNPETPAQSPVPTPGALVAQPHGGALRYGSEPGGSPGPGRPPSVVREAMLNSFADRLPVLEAIADDPKQRTSDRLKALELLARYGLGATVEVESRSLRVTMDPTRNPALVRLLESDPGLRTYLRRNPDVCEWLPPAVRAQVLQLPPRDEAGAPD
jgi:hypothetical protein